MPWIVTSLLFDAQPGQTIVHAITPEPVELTLRTQSTPPARTPRYRDVRGMPRQCGFTINWEPGACYTATEAPPSTSHTFTVPTSALPDPIYGALIEGSACALPAPSTPPFPIPTQPGVPTFHAIFRMSADQPIVTPGLEVQIHLDTLLSTDDPDGWSNGPNPWNWQANNTTPGTVLIVAHWIIRHDFLGLDQDQKLALATTTYVYEYSTTPPGTHHYDANAMNGWVPGTYPDDDAFMDCQPFFNGAILATDAGLFTELALTYTR